MSTKTKLPPPPAAAKASAAADADDAAMLPASTELPAEVHAKIAAHARAGERSFSAQLRMIARAWAQSSGIGDQN